MVIETVLKTPLYHTELVAQFQSSLQINPKTLSYSDYVLHLVTCTWNFGEIPKSPVVRLIVSLTWGCKMFKQLFVFLDTFILCDTFSLLYSFYAIAIMAKCHPYIFVMEILQKPSFMFILNTTSL